MSLANPTSAFQFELDASGPALAVIRMIFAIAAFGEVLNAAIFVLGHESGDTFLFAATFWILSALIFSIGLWRRSQGVAELTDSRLEVRTLGGKAQYKWDDIARMRILTLNQLGIPTRLWARMTGLNENRRFVDIKLNRSLRFGVVPRRYGTDVPGVPSFVARGIRLFVADPDGFVRAAGGFLGS